MGRLLNSMVEVRVLAVLQIALVACVIAVPAPLGTEVEMLQVAPDIMAVDSMDAMISSAMKAEVKADIGDANQSDEEMNEEEAEALKKIAEIRRLLLSLQLRRNGTASLHNGLRGPNAAKSAAVGLSSASARSPSILPTAEKRVQLTTE